MASDLSQIVKRLDVMIGLLVRSLEKDGKKLSVRDQIRYLSEVGMRPVEIALILGKTQGFVNKELAVFRKE